MFQCVLNYVRRLLANRKLAERCFHQLLQTLRGYMKNCEITMYMNRCELNHFVLIIYLSNKYVPLPPSFYFVIVLQGGLHQLFSDTSCLRSFKNFAERTLS
jgi:hypothetical protein